jgi:FKBP12-rapamycin complex-associated protein
MSTIFLSISSLCLLRCLKSLGEWQKLYTLSEEAWRMDPAVMPHKKVAPLGARAAWALGKWDAMLRFVNKTKEDDLQAWRRCGAVN